MMFAMLTDTELLGLPIAFVVNISRMGAIGVASLPGRQCMSVPCPCVSARPPVYVRMCPPSVCPQRIRVSTRPPVYVRAVSVCVRQAYVRTLSVCPPGCQCMSVPCPRVSVWVGLPRRPQLDE